MYMNTKLLFNDKTGYLLALIEYTKVQYVVYQKLHVSSDENYHPFKVSFS